MYVSSNSWVAINSLHLRSSFSTLHTHFASITCLLIQIKLYLYNYLLVRNLLNPLILNIGQDPTWTYSLIIHEKRENRQFVSGFWRTPSYPSSSLGRFLFAIENIDRNMTLNLGWLLGPFFWQKVKRVAWCFSDVVFSLTFVYVVTLFEWLIISGSNFFYKSLTFLTYFYRLIIKVYTSSGLR